MSWGFWTVTTTFPSSASTGCIHAHDFACLILFFAYQSTIFQLCEDGSSWVEPVLSKINVSCSRTQRSDACEARTGNTTALSEALFNWATALPNVDKIWTPALLSSCQIDKAQIDYLMFGLSEWAETFPAVDLRQLLCLYCKVLRFCLISSHGCPTHNAQNYSIQSRRCWVILDQVDRVPDQCSKPRDVSWSSIICLPACLTATLKIRARSPKLFQVFIMPMLYPCKFGSNLPSLAYKKVSCQRWW